MGDYRTARAAAIEASADSKSFESGDMLAALDSARQNSQSDDSPKLNLAAAEGEDDRDPRFGIGGNHPPPEELIPERLQQWPAGPVVQFLDNLLDITGPADEANLEVATLQMRALLRAIHDVDPNYVYESIEPPGGLEGMSWQGRANVINGLRAALRVLSDRMHVLFEADPEDKTGDAQAGREIIHEMEDILKSTARRRGPR